MLTVFISHEAQLCKFNRFEHDTTCPVCVHLWLNSSLCFICSLFEPPRRPRIHTKRKTRMPDNNHQSRISNTALSRISNASSTALHPFLSLRYLDPDPFSQYLAQSASNSFHHSSSGYGRPRFPKSARKLSLSSGFKSTQVKCVSIRKFSSRILFSMSARRTAASSSTI